MVLSSKWIVVVFLAVVAFPVEIEIGYKVSGEVENLKNCYCWEITKMAHFAVTVVEIAADGAAVAAAVYIHSELA